MAGDRKEAPRLRLGQFVVEPELRVIRDGDSEVHLEPKVMRCLELLIDRAGRVVTREEFFNEVWPNAEIGDEVLSRCIYQLRSHLKDSSREQAFIATIPKRGYQLVVAPEPIESGPETREGAPVVPRPRWPVAAAVVGVVAAAAILAVYWPGARDEIPPPTGGDLVAPSLAAGSGAPAIVVIPYSDLSEAGDKGYFSDGITDELLHGLGQIQGLRIIGRESASRLADATPEEIRKHLDVDVILTGSVRFNGDEVRITNRLIDTATGEQLWSASFNGSQADVFNIEDRIASAIVQQLEIQLADGTSAPRVRRTTDSQRAHQLYLEGRFYLKRRSSGALADAADYFRAAIETDPDFSLAYSGLADAHMLLSQYGGMPLDEATAIAGTAIETALRLDPALAEAHASNGLMLLQNQQLADAAEALRTAAAYDPGYVNAHLWLGRALDLDAQFRKALAVYRRAHDLDPLSPLLNLNVGRMLTHMGRFDDGRGYLERILELDRDFANVYWALGYSYLLTGQLDEAQRHYESALARGLTYQPQVYAQLAQVHLERGEFDVATKWLEDAENVAEFSFSGVRVRHLLQLAQGNAADIPRWYLALYERAPEQHVLLLRAAAAESWLGNHAVAVELYERALEQSPELTATILWDYAWGLLIANDIAWAYGQIGQVERQQTMLEQIGRFFDEAEERGLAVPGTHYARCVWQALRGNSDAALRELDRARQSGYVSSWVADIDPKLENVRSEPRYAAIANPGDQRP